MKKWSSFIDLSKSDIFDISLSGIIKSNLSFIPPNHHADYTGSYYTGPKEIVHMEIAMQEMLE